MSLKVGPYSDTEHGVIKSCLAQGLNCGDIAQVLRRDVLSVQNYCKTHKLHTEKDIAIAAKINSFWRDQGETRDVVSFYHGRTESRLVNWLPS